jgi:hypothetical protein
MDGWMRAVQTNEQQMEQTEPRVDAEHPPKKPPGRAMCAIHSVHHHLSGCGGSSCPKDLFSLAINLVDLQLKSLARRHWTEEKGFHL